MQKRSHCKEMGVKMKKYPKLLPVSIQGVYYTKTGFGAMKPCFRPITLQRDRFKAYLKGLKILAGKQCKILYTYHTKIFQ